MKAKTAVKTLFAAVQADVLFIQKRHDLAALWASRLSKKVIFDFDDALWLPYPKETRKETKIPRLMRQLHSLLASSDLVITGNSYLQAYAAKYNSNTVVIPTVVDLERYVPLARRNDSSRVTIGWVGSDSTLPYLTLLEDVFTQLANRYSGRVQLKVICNEPFKHAVLPVVNIAWRLQSEVEDLQDIDIGIMPLANTEWEMGKCGFKLLQYMSLGIPAVASPIGVNQEIIEQGINGFLASSSQDWLDHLSLLIEKAELRHQIGMAGRERIAERYSLQSIQAEFYRLIRETANS